MSMFSEGEGEGEETKQEPVNVTVYLNAPMVFPSTAPDPDQAPAAKEK